MGLSLFDYIRFDSYYLIRSEDIDPSSTTSCTLIAAISGGDEDPRRRSPQRNKQSSTITSLSPHAMCLQAKIGFKTGWKQSAEDISGPRQSLHFTCSIKTNEIFIHEQEFEPFSASGSVVRLIPTLVCILADIVYDVDFRSAVRYGNYFMLHNFKRTHGPLHVIRKQAKTKDCSLSF
ncbi:hypothetical protein C5167_027264, partial [Papaver somniferum]